MAIGLLLGTLGWLGWTLAGDLIHTRFYPQLSGPTVALVGSTILLNVLRDYLNSLQQGLQRFTDATIVLCLDDCGALLILLPLLAGPSAMTNQLIVASSVIGIGVSVVAAIVMLVRAGVRPWPRLHLAIAREAMAFGIRGHVGRLANLLTWRLDVVILSTLATVEVVGCYAVAFKVAELFRPLGASLTFVLRPLLASLSTAEARLRGVVLYRRVFLINLASVLVMAVVGGPAIVALFGQEFTPAVPAFQILLIGLAAHGADPVLNGYNVGIGRPEYNTYTALAGLLVTVAADLILIPSHGLIGAAIASTLAYTARAAAFTAIFVVTSEISLRQLIGVEEYRPGPA
jgi:O-antigen/teichoic acid export membrane protein